MSFTCSGTRLIPLNCKTSRVNCGNIQYVVRSSAFLERPYAVDDSKTNWFPGKRKAYLAPCLQPSTKKNWLLKLKVCLKKEWNTRSRGRANTWLGVAVTNPWDVPVPFVTSHRQSQHLSVINLGEAWLKYQSLLWHHKGLINSAACRSTRAMNRGISKGSKGWTFLICGDPSSFVKVLQNHGGKSNS